LPSPEEVKELSAARGWAPYESVACWYIWQSLDNKPT
jgi:3-methyladenine DNA glycosylase/8-oxoguanine DNA glycosylase